MLGIHFDTKEGAFGKPGVIVPGDSAHSKMYLRVSNPNEAMRMPPVSSGRKLTPAQIDTIKNWIDSGAKWETHWAYVAPVRPELPSSEERRLGAHTRSIDLCSRSWKSENLSPAPEADKATLAPPGHVRSYRLAAHRQPNCRRFLRIARPMRMKK